MIQQMVGNQEDGRKLLGNSERMTEVRTFNAVGVGQIETISKRLEKKVGFLEIVLRYDL